MIDLITNANVFAPEPLGLQHLLVCAGRLVHIGPKIPQLDDSLNVNTIDLDGATLVPGFIDGHAHITGGGGEAGPSTRVPPMFLSQITQAGVTSVVGLLGTDDLTRSTQSLLTTVMGLREEGLSAWCYTGGYHVPAVTLTDSVKSDIVNLEPVIGVGEVAISDHRSSQPTRDEILRLASECHVAGLMTGKAGIVHFHLGDGQRGLSLIRECLEIGEIPPRVFNPTHVNRNKPLFEEACALTESGCSIDITAVPESFVEGGWSATESVHRYLDQGFNKDKLSISSDGGGCLPHFDPDGSLLRMGFASCSAMHDTYVSLISSGLAPETILPFMTSNVADLLKLKRKGKVAAGYDADFVVLDSHNSILHVMANGQWHIRSKEQLRNGLFEK